LNLNVNVDQMFTELFQQVDDLIIVTHISGKIEFINRMASEALHITTISTSYLNMNEPSQEIWKNFITKIKKEINANFTLMIQNDEGNYVEVKLLGYYLQEREVIFSRVFLLPIAKTKISNAENFLPLHHMIKNIAHGVILTAMDGKIITANDKALKLIDREQWQLENRSHDCLFEDFSHDANSVIPYYRDLARNELATITGAKKSSNGKISYFNFESKIDTMLNILITTITDETEKVALLEKIEHQHSLNVIGQHIATLAHEIRNPMTTLQGFLQLMKNQGNEESQRFFMIMESELQRMDLLVSDLLNLSKPKTVEYEQLCFLEVIKEVIDLMQAQAIISNTIIEFEYDYLADYSIIGSRLRLKQMAINLVKNAIEAMENGGNIRIQLVVTPNNKLEFIVRDEGKGMDEQIIEKLFTPYYTTKLMGTGLGLLLVKKVIDEHNGEITINSKVGNGSEFIIEFNQSNEYYKNYFRNLEIYGAWASESQNNPIV